MKKIYAFATAVLPAWAFAQITCAPPFTVQTFGYTGSPQTFIVPANVSQLYIEAFGASGADGQGTAPGAAGLGAKVTGTIDVTGGSTYYIYVGQAGSGMTGGYNGGGIGGYSNGGGGGGATDLRYGGITPADRIMVAGGGGGGGGTGCETIVLAGGAGGMGGGGNGADGASSPDGIGGLGAIGPAGGAQGAGCSGFLGSPGATATNENGGAGGAGQACCCFVTPLPSDPGGGGGGGGLVGGGGGGGGSAGNPGCSGNDKGGGGGGAGGTSHASASFTDPTLVMGVNSGHGSVNICYDATESLQEHASAAANVFMDQLTHTLNVTFPIPPTTAEVEIYSTVGKKVYGTTVASAISTLDVSQLSVGIYVVKVSANGTFQQVRIMVGR